MSPQPAIRIGDAEREAAAASLGEHYAAGRLTKQEYDERAEVVWGTRTAADLHPLFTDLPSAQRRAPVGATARPTRPRFQAAGLPLFPLFAVLVGMALLLGAPWLILVFGALLFSFGRRWSHPRHGGHFSCR